MLHRMALVSFRLFCKNLGNLQEFFGQMDYRPPWQKIARTPMQAVRAAACIRYEDKKITLYIMHDLKEHCPLFN